MVVVSALRVIVCDDQPIVREGVAQILRNAGFDVVATAVDAADLVGKARAHQPEVVVTEARLSGEDPCDGLCAAEVVRRELPETAVLVLSQDIEGSSALGLLGESSGGVGYLLMRNVADVATLTNAVDRVARGGSEIDPDVIAALVSRALDGDPLSRLTDKEQDVLALIAAGRSNRGIAMDLVVTVAAVERHVTSIFSKLDLQRSPHEHRRVLAVLRYLGTR